MALPSTVTAVGSECGASAAATCVTSTLLAPAATDTGAALTPAGRPASCTATAPAEAALADDAGAHGGGAALEDDRLVGLEHEREERVRTGWAGRVGEAGGGAGVPTTVPPGEPATGPLGVPVAGVRTDVSEPPLPQAGEW